MSYNLVDPVTGELTQVAGNADSSVIIDDSTASGNKTWSSEKINANLGELGEKIGEIPLIYNQNTDILAYALTCPKEKRTLVRIYSANATNNPYGVSTDTDFIYEIDKINFDDLFITVRAKDVKNNREFINTKNETKWLGWQELATMDKVESKYEEATLDTPIDWNTLNTKARYYVSGGAIMTNAPMQQPFGELVVETAGDGSVCRVQKFFSFDGKLYMRRWTGSGWSEWYRFDGISI